MEDRIEIEQQEDGFMRHSEIFSDGSRNDRWMLGDCWIKEYDFHQGYERKNYIAYRAVGPRKDDRLPWTAHHARAFPQTFFELDAAKAAVKQGAAT